MDAMLNLPHFASAAATEHWVERHSSFRSNDSMTSAVKKRAPALNPGSQDSPNGSVVAPSYSEDGDMNGSMSDTSLELMVVLPNEQTIYVTVDSSKQMMDLTIQLCASNKLSPGSHTIHVFDEVTGRRIEYSASQNIGSLGVTTAYLVNKKAQKQKTQQRKEPKSAQPFEKTQRLTVNLPRNQKMVTRVNPKASLANIYKMICDEKNLDPYKYELRHPTRPNEALNMASPLVDYGINEIVVVSASAPDYQRSLDVTVNSETPEVQTSFTTMPRKSAPPQDTGAFMPGMTEKKKKKGIFSIFSRKSKFRPGEASYNADASTLSAQSSHSTMTHKTATMPASHSSHSHMSAPPTTVTRAKSEDLTRAQMEPLTVNTNTTNIIPAKPPRKKRPAPPPPPGTSVKTDLTVPEPVAQTQLTHSRASSHSSGFDETTSSPLESPGNSSRESSNTASSGQTKPSIDAASIDSADMVHDISRTRSHDPKGSKPASIPEVPSPTSSTGNTSSLPRTMKKRRAPAPPPPPGTKSSPEAPSVSSQENVSPAASVETKVTDPQPPEDGTSMGAEPSETPVDGTTSQYHQSHVEAQVKVTSDAKLRHEERSAEELKAALVEELKQGKLEVQGDLGLEDDLGLEADLDLDLETTSPSESMEEHQIPRPRPAQFIAPPPPNTPPPPITPSTQSRAFIFANHGIEVADCSTQVHVSPRSGRVSSRRCSSCSSICSLESFSDVDSGFVTAQSFTSLEAEEQLGCQDTSEAKSEVSVFVDQMNQLTENVDQGISNNSEVDQSASPESLKPSVGTLEISPASKDDDSSSEASSVMQYDVNKESDDSDIEGDLPEKAADGVVLVKKLHLENELAEPSVQLVGSSFLSKEAEGSPAELPKPAVTVKPDMPQVVIPEAPVSDSGNSTATDTAESDLEYDQRRTLPCDIEITFDHEEVMYVSPHEPSTPSKDAPPVFLVSQLPPPIITDISYSIEEEDEPEEDEEPKEGEPEDIIPMRGSRGSQSSNNDEPVAIPDEKEKKDDSVEEQPALDEEEQFDLNDYRISKYIKEEVVDFSFRTINKPKPIVKEEIKKVEAKSDTPVMSLRQLYRKPMRKNPETSIIESKMGVHIEPEPIVKAKPPPEPKPVTATKPVVVTSEDSGDITPPTPFQDPQDQPSLDKQEKDSKKINISPESSKVDSFYEDSITSPVKHLANANIGTTSPVKHLANANIGKTEKESFDHEVISPPSVKQGVFMTSTPVKQEVDTDQDTRRPKDHPTPHPAAVQRRTTSPESHSMRFFGPRPWGARNQSEPSVKDVRKALASHSRQSTGPSYGHVASVKDDDHVLYNGGGQTRNQVRQNITDLSFSPGTEGEADVMLEEKSISFMAHPPERKSILKNSRNYQQSTPVSPPWLDNKPADDSYVTRETSSSGLKTAKSAPSVNTELKTVESPNEDKDKKTFQSQYEELKQQFGKWQQQIIDNQAVLAQKNIISGNQTPAADPVQPTPSRKVIVSSSSKYTSGSPAIEETVHVRPENHSTKREETVSSRYVSESPIIETVNKSPGHVTRQEETVSSRYTREPQATETVLHRRPESVSTRQEETISSQFVSESPSVKEPDLEKPIEPTDSADDSITSRYIGERPGYRRIAFGERFKPAPLTRYEAAPLTKAERSDSIESKTHIGSKERVSAMDLRFGRSRSRRDSSDSLSPVGSPVRTTFTSSNHTSPVRSGSPPPDVLLRRGSPSPPPPTSKLESYQVQRISSAAPASPPPMPTSQNIPRPPEPPKVTVTTKSVTSSSRSGKGRTDPRFEPKLDPREELMIAIRNAGGRNALSKVPVNKTKWYYTGSTS